MTSKFRTFPCIVPQNPKAAMNHWFTKLERSAILRPGREEPFLLPPFSESTTMTSQFRTFLSIVPKPLNKFPRHSPTKPQCRTGREEPFLLPPFFRIHDKDKPVQNISLYSLAKPQGSDEPLVHQMTEVSHFANRPRGTIFAATFFRIHDNDKPVQNISFYSPQATE